MNRFIIKRPDEEHYETVIDLILQDFRVRERMFVCSGATPEDPREGHELYRDWIQQEVSLIAVDTEDGHIVGAAVNMIVRKENNTFEISPEMSVRQRFFYTMIGQIESGVDFFEELQVDKGIELTLLSVKKDFAGRGLGKKLTEETIQLAKTLGYKFVQSVPTAPETIHIFESAGFETRNERKFSDFSEFEGSPAFPLATPTDRARFVIKKL